MPTDHRGRFVGSPETSHGGVAKRPRIGLGVSSLPGVIPVMTGASKFATSMANTPEYGQKPYGDDEWGQAGEAHRQEVASYERVPGTQKQVGTIGDDARPLFRSIDQVGPMYSVTLHDPESDLQWQAKEGTYTKWGARRMGKKMQKAMDVGPDYYAYDKGRD